MTFRGKIFVTASLAGMIGCVEREHRVYVERREPDRVVVEQPAPPPPQREVVIVEPPPPERVEVIPERRPGYFWIRGHYIHDGRHYVWVGGHWERMPHERAEWVPGRWDNRRGGYIWIEGYWR